MGKDDSLSLDEVEEDAQDYLQTILTLVKVPSMVGVVPRIGMEAVLLPMVVQNDSTSPNKMLNLLGANFH